MPGPPPKRSSQRRRQNKTEPVDRVVSGPAVSAPRLSGKHTAQARRFWRALKLSGQAQFYEPSDWAQAELIVEAIDSFVRKPSAMMLASINSAMSNLLVTEGDRRRARLELERPEPAGEPAEDAEIAQLEEFRSRVRSS